MANVVITKTSNDITKVAYDDKNYYFSKNVLIYNENDAIHLKDGNFNLVIDYDDISDKLGSSDADEYIITLLEANYFKKGGGGDQGGETFTGTEIPLDGYYQRDDSSNDTSTWTLGTPVNGAVTEIIINQSSEPAPFSTDTGVVQIPNTTDFAADTLQLLTVKVIGEIIYYFYTSLE